MTGIKLFFTTNTSSSNCECIWSIGIVSPAIYNNKLGCQFMHTPIKPRRFFFPAYEFLFHITYCNALYENGSIFRI